MIFVNVGLDHRLPTAISSAKGIVLMPLHDYRERLERDHSIDSVTRLVDPQLYLASLDGTEASKACAKLCSYPWFGVEGAPDYEEGMKKADWHNQLIECAKENWPGQPPDSDNAKSISMQALEFQDSIGSDILLLPCPLISDGTDDGETIAKWIDEGLAAREELELRQPVVATIALDEPILVPSAFAAYCLVDSIVDQITARSELSGAYVVINRSETTHPFQMSASVSRAYLTLARRLSHYGLENVIVNYADVLGLACVGLGASGFGIGDSFSRRRLSLAGLKDADAGRRLPRFYSHPVLAEFYTEKDLDRIVALNLMKHVSDSTSFSAQLMDALADGRSASEIVSWAENYSNDSAAKRHLLERLTVADKLLVQAQNRATSTIEWLEEAHMRQLYLQERLNEVGHALKGSFAPARRWLDELTSMI